MKIIRKTKHKQTRKTSEIVPNSVSKKHRFCTSFAINQKLQISIPIEPARSELIFAGVGPSQTTRELPLEIEAKIEKKSKEKSTKKASGIHPENAKKTATKNIENH